MKYYDITNNKVVLTSDGKEALKRLGISIEQLKYYPEENLNKERGYGCDTFVEQALFNGKGVSWLGDCRVPVSENDRHEYGIDGDEGDPTVNCYGHYDRVGYHQNKAGRFPANLLVSDDALNDGKNYASHPGVYKNSKAESIFGIGESEFNINRVVSAGDSGSFSRYFDLDLWFEETLKKLPKEVQKTFPFLIVPKAAKSEREDGLNGLVGEYPERYGEMKGTDEHAPNRQNQQKNFHSTVKPIKLMSYLITLGSREGDIVLDPHAGSGTTCIAARMLNRFSIGIDMEESYLRDIAVPKLKEMAKQKSILDFGSD